jgi:hypothetical protein
MEYLRLGVMAWVDSQERNLVDKNPNPMKSGWHTVENGSVEPWQNETCEASRDKSYPRERASRGVL